MKYLFLFIALFSLPAHAAERPVVMELFTSQGCPACPPGDEVFAKLIRKNPDVIALSFHVDYWDRQGWKDPFSLPQATDRQRAYADAHGKSKLFTPQVMVNGTWSFIGTKEEDIDEALEDARDSDEPYLETALERTSSGLRIRVSPGGSNAVRGTADLWFVTYNEKDVTRVLRGANWGTTATNHHSVRQLLYLGQWQENAVALDLDFMPDTDFVAVLVQRPNGGKILGAAGLRLH